MYIFSRFIFTFLFLRIHYMANQLEYLNQLKQAVDELDKQITDEINEKERIIQRFPQIKLRQTELDSIIDTLVYKRDSLEVLLSEIDKGFEKVQASVKSLYLLSLSKLKILKRKYSSLLKLGAKEIRGNPQLHIKQKLSRNSHFQWYSTYNCFQDTLCALHLLPE